MYLLKIFDISKLTVDTTEGAVVIAEQGYTSFEGNSKSWFSMVFEFKTRIFITVINGINGFSLANVEVLLYLDGNNARKHWRV